MNNLIKSYKVFCLLIFSLQISFAQQSSFTISGNVTDFLTGETLLGATIIIKNVNKGTISNEYGFYSITLPKGTYTLHISYVGYESFEQTLDLNASKKINIALTPASDELKEVVVSGEVSKMKSQVNTVLTGVSNLGKADIQRIPALLGEPDVTRAILTQPGISSIGEGTAGFNVRGGNIDQNLILLDEAPVYNSSHVFGFFSVFNTDAIKNLKLYKGGIPARFGGRASSVLDIRQREGSTKKLKMEGGIGALFSKLTIEAPIIKDKLSFLISGRRSYFDLFFKLSNDKNIKNTNVYFYDLSSKIAWKINDKNTLFFSGYFGADVFRNKIDQGNNNDNSNNDNSSTMTIDFTWKNATSAIRWNHLFSDQLFMNLSSIYSIYDYGLSTSGSQSRGGPTENSENTGDFQWSSSILNYIVKPNFTLFLEDDTKFRFGIDNILYRFSPAKIINNGSTDIDFKTENLLTVAPYLSYSKKWGKFSINAGIRYSYAANIGPYEVAHYEENIPKMTESIKETVSYEKGKIIADYGNFEPRLALNYRYSDLTSFKLSYNRMFQYINLISNTTGTLPFDIWKPVGLHVKPLEVNQVALGYAKDTENGTYNFNVEIYFKTFKNMLEYKDGAELFLNKNIEKELLQADGYSYGLELAAHKVSGKLQGNANYTFSLTRRKTTSPYKLVNINNGDYYPSNYDRPHMFNATLSYKISKKWDLNLFFTYQTGRPITDPSSKYTVNGKTYVAYDYRNSSRLPDAHRMDISLVYQVRSKNRWKSSWSFGLYNAYKNKSAFSRNHNLGANGDLQTTQFYVIGAIVPFINYNFKF